MEFADRQPWLEQAFLCIKSHEGAWGHRQETGTTAAYRWTGRSTPPTAASFCGWVLRRGGQARCRSLSGSRRICQAGDLGRGRTRENVWAVTSYLAWTFLFFCVITALSLLMQGLA